MAIPNSQTGNQARLNSDQSQGLDHRKVLPRHQATELLGLRRTLQPVHLRTLQSEREDTAQAEQDDRLLTRHHLQDHHTLHEEVLRHTAEAALRTELDLEADTLADHLHQAMRLGLHHLTHLHRLDLHTHREAALLTEAAAHTVEEAAMAGEADGLEASDQARADLADEAEAAGHLTQTW